MYNDYLIHHGVKGMKWGVRKQLQARKRFKRAQNKTNYKKATDKWSKIAKEFDKKDNNRFQKAETERQIRNAETISYKQNYTMVKKGKYEVRKAMLLDAGYSKKEADLGARWMETKNWNISWSDDSAWRYKHMKY